MKNKNRKVQIDIKLKDKLVNIWNNIGISLTDSEKLKYLLNQELKKILIKVSFYFKNLLINH